MNHSAWDVIPRRNRAQFSADSGWGWLAQLLASNMGPLKNKTPARGRGLRTERFVT